MKLNNTYINKNKYMYKDFNYWEESFSNHNALFSGCFNDFKITTESKIAYIGFLNSNKNVLEYSFTSYPSAYAILGFIQHIFLPTAFFTWYDTHYNDFCIPIDTFENIISDISKNNFIDIQGRNLFLYSYEFLDSLWDLDENSIMSELINFCNDFNDIWDNNFDKKIFIKLFNSPEEIYPFVMHSIGGWDFDEFIKDEISMSKETFKSTCENVLSQPFINERFIDILNINMPILF